eukprot:1385675-Alexandrium_andersonii.AAC.1
MAAEGVGRLGDRRKGVLGSTLGVVQRAAVFRDWSGSQNLSAAVGGFVRRKERVLPQRPLSPPSTDFLAANPEVDED